MNTHRLEIGAGGGLVGLAVAKGCKPQHPLYITDQLEMLELMGHNIVLNEAEGRVNAMILNWFVQHRLILPHDMCNVESPGVCYPSHASEADIRYPRHLSIGNTGWMRHHISVARDHVLSSPLPPYCPTPFLPPMAAWLQCHGISRQPQHTSLPSVPHLPTSILHAC